MCLFRLLKTLFVKKTLINLISKVRKVFALTSDSNLRDLIYSSEKDYLYYKISSLRSAMLSNDGKKTSMMCPSQNFFLYNVTVIGMKKRKI